MQFLRADTAVKVVVGPFVLPGDAVTPVIDFTVSSAAEAELMKHDAAAPTDLSNNLLAHLAALEGYYNLSLTTGNVDTEGMLSTFFSDAALILPVRNDFMVMNQNAFDALYAASGTDLLEIDVQEIDGAAAAATNWGSSAGTIIVGTVQAGSISQTEFPTDITLQDDMVIGRTLIFVDGPLIKAAKPITDFANTDQVITTNAFPVVPEVGDTFVIV